jgi:hypothetical protein
VFTLSRYGPSNKEAWDRFVSTAKNATFLFFRDYMDYHAHRFIDHSLLFHQDGQLIAVLPASLHEDNTLISHGGLTFGGVVSDSSMSAQLMMTLFAELFQYLRDMRIACLRYKAVPHIYHELPAEEDRYALFRVGAHVYRRDVTFTIPLHRRLPFQERRRRAVKKAKASGLTVRQNADLDSFWPILEDNLWKRHNVKPVHSLVEMRLLREHFPNNIKLFATYLDNSMLAGVLIYEHRRVAHAQYISASEEGKALGALDILFESLITEYSHNHDFFDFGISTEEQGRSLNVGLSNHKEGFGGRAIVHDFYELDLASEVA